MSRSTRKFSSSAQGAGIRSDDSGGTMVMDPPQQMMQNPEEESQRQQNPTLRNDELRYLAADEYSAWDVLVEISPQGSVFCKTWWLRAVSPDIRVLGYFESGRLVAGIPLYFERRLGLRMCCMPKLVQNWGVVAEPIHGKQVAVTSRETQILDAFAEYLAQEPIFMQLFHPECDNWLPFYWRGFTQTTHYTYVIDELQSLDNVWQGLEKRQRAKIRKAQKDGLKVRPCSADVVFNMSVKTFQRQDRRNPYTLEYLQRLYAAAQQNNAGACFAVEDAEGRIYVAGFFLWDTRRGYYLVSGQDPELRDSYAGSLLAWHLIEFASAHTSIFDFEGSMKQSIERVFRSYGAKRLPYYRITKLPGWVRAPLCLAGKFQI
jgi:CelD/BcsL family acetyltransferase involved in cellulose biosynthesis